MPDRNAYQDFAEWMRGDWMGLAEADELLPLLEAAYSAEEARLLTGMPFSGRTLEELAEIKQMDSAELGPALDTLARKGGLFRTVRGDTVRYSLNDAVFSLFRAPLWPGADNERTRAMAPLANQYYYHGFWEIFRNTHTKGLRTVPIEGTIEDTRQILPFEEVTKVLETKERFSVTTCPCRHRKNLDEDLPGCDHTLHNCLHFDRLAEYTIENGMGREITREETREILRHSADEGLVHALDNKLEGADTICNCCECCCIFMEAYHKLGHPEGLAPSNYRVRVNAEVCTGCGLCVRRCPMDALQLVDMPEARGRVITVASEEGGTRQLKNKTGQVAVLTQERCIGCGVCAHKCSTRSLVLERLETLTSPPRNGRELVRSVLADNEAARLAGKPGG